MKKAIILSAIIATLTGYPAVPCAAEDAGSINGAGATFPAPIYLQWAYQYNQINPGIRVNYQSIGSGAGIQQIKSRTVDYGASDAPMKAAELDSNGLIQFPMIMGGVVPIVNVGGISAGQMKLDGPTLADIFRGKVTRWDDPAIRALNPELALPAKAIAVVHRSDGSGTTWIFTNYLSSVSADWAKEVGADKAVAWPAGNGGKGNEGVAAFVQQMDGSIGYVEYAYALQNRMSYVRLKNADGNFVAPSRETFAAAAANADWAHAPGFYMILVNQPGKDSWQISGASFIILPKQQSNAARARNMLSFFNWCYRQGKEPALKLDYVPLPENVIGLVQEAWKSNLKAEGKSLWP